MHTIKYRTTEERLRPRQTKLQIPGWAGEPEPRPDGSHEYAWHCVPFSEAAQYGIEVFYPYDNELRVSTQGGRLEFDGARARSMRRTTTAKRNAMSASFGKKRATAGRYS
jgi:hypothetical protein